MFISVRYIFILIIDNYHKNDILSESSEGQYHNLEAGCITDESSSLKGLYHQRPGISEELSKHQTGDGIFVF